MEKGFEVKTHAPVVPDDIRGPLFEWKLPDGRQITVCLRKKGIKTGGHYHKGKDPSKNPEKIFIAAGKVKLTLIPPDKQAESVVLRAGDSVTIQPNIWHRFEILEDSVIIEYRITYFDRSNPDTFVQ